ncbi:MAG TPA: glycoside hydrolase family 16 protein [Luteolibacter sp.]|nr:glycoside hydrolase family 16 protein [Luteolibacter sp.]
MPSLCPAAETDKPQQYPGYKLVWADEFNKDGKPDPAHWTYEKGFVRNNELQWYQQDNATVSGGRLIIEGRRESKPNPDFKEGEKHWRNSRRTIEYTSSSLITKGLHSWQYGRFEVRAKISAKPGLWPAIWTLGVNGEWPDNGEVDIMEYYGGNILANACWGTKERWKAKWDSSKTPVGKLGDAATWDQSFHVWRMDWDENEIRLFLDDKLLNTIDVAKAVNASGNEPKHPFRQPHYLLLNLAIGGNAGGDPSKTEFPTRYEVDYVRIYQKDGK